MVGDLVGFDVAGCLVGRNVGCLVGNGDGDDVGCFVGEVVGFLMTLHPSSYRTCLGS